MAAPLPTPFDQRDGHIWFDGQMVPWRGKHINILNHGLHYASSVFEGLRVYNGKIFKLEEHTNRLFKSAALLDMRIPFTPEQLNQATLAVVQQQQVDNGYIRPVAWRGSEMMAISAQYTKIHVAIAAWNTKTYYDPAIVDRGIDLTIAKWRRPAPDTAPTESKAAGLYMICTLSKHEAERDGFNDALMLDWRGLIAEATGANIFLVQQGALHTPTPDCFLNGITRQTVIALAKKHGIPVVERPIAPTELAHTDEVFITGTAAELTPVRRIGEYRFTPAAVTKQLREAYQALVRA